METQKMDSTFGIGAVSRLTGISMDTLRVWERRYGAVVPSRSDSNRRSYSQSEVKRLLLVKKLIERGETIGSIIHLPEESLRERLRAHHELNQDSAVVSDQHLVGSAESDTVTAVIFGEFLPYQIRYWSSDLAGLRIVKEYSSCAEFVPDALDKCPDIAIIEIPSLHEAALGQVSSLIGQANFKRVIVIYAFATKNVLDRLDSLGITMERAPINPQTLLSLCSVTADDHARHQHPSGKGLSVKPRIFTGKQLAEIAEQKSTLACECPRHLVDLISRVGAFEKYSLDCESRDSKDSHVHAQLHQLTAIARHQLEDALLYLLEAEGQMPESTLSKTP